MCYQNYLTKCLNKEIVATSTYQCGVPVMPYLCSQVSFSWFVSQMKVDDCWHLVPHASVNVIWL